jgi:hypothetical protein
VTVVRARVGEEDARTPLAAKADAPF